MGQYVCTISSADEVVTQSKVLCSSRTVRNWKHMTHASTSANQSQNSTHTSWTRGVCMGRGDRDSAE